MKVVSEPVLLDKGEVSTIPKDLLGDMPYADSAREQDVETMFVDDGEAAVATQLSDKFSPFSPNYT